MNTKIQRFEELIAWQKARALTKMVYLQTRQGSFSRDFGLSGQIQRASVSIMANIAEGFERSSLKEFDRFLHIAKSSCAELRSHLYVAKDIDYLPQSMFQRIISNAEEVARILSGLRASVRRKIREQNTARKQNC